MANKKKKFLSKKTIGYIETIIYILAIILGIFVCDFGHIYLKMLPILFFLGFVGRIVFDKPVITTVFGVITAICINEMIEHASFSDNLFISLCNGLNIAMGELSGEYFTRSKKLMHKKKKNNKAIFTYIVTLCIFVVSGFVFLYTSGDYISYFKAKKRLDNYLEESYKDQEFKLVKCKYNFYRSKTYTYELRNKTKEINTNFIVVKDNNYAVYDEYQFIEKSQNNKKINEEFSKYMENIDTKLEFKIGYLNSGKLKLIISRNSRNVDDNIVKEFVRDTNEVILKLYEFNKKNKINYIELSLVDVENNENSLVSNLELDDIKKSDNSYEYIFNSLVVEFIDN